MTFLKLLGPLVWASLTLAPALARAEGAVGNGGDGILMDGKTYLLDFVEAGVEEAPYFDEKSKPNAEYTETLKKIFIDVDGVPIELISRKLVELDNVDKLLSRLLLKTMGMYYWRVVKQTLINIPDENTTIDVPQGKMVQLAIRSQHTMRLGREGWKQLNDEHRAGLIFHETVYSMVEPDSGRQNSQKAREVVGHLFTKDLSRDGAVGLTKIMGTLFGFLYKPMKFEQRDDSFRTGAIVSLGRGGSWGSVGNGFFTVSVDNKPGDWPGSLKDLCNSKDYPKNLTLLFQYTTIKSFFMNFSEPNSSEAKVYMSVKPVSYDEERLIEHKPYKDAADCVVQGREAVEYALKKFDGYQ